MRCQQRYRVVFERHDTSPKSNTIISINVIAVTSGKHSEHCTEPACFVICTLLNHYDIASCTVLHAVPEHATQT